MLRERHILTKMSSPTTPTKGRNWKRYNNALVSRAELFLDLKALKNWEKDLRRLNKRKNGRRFIYPECFIRYLALLQTYYRLSCRAVESLLAFLEKHIPSMRKPDHSTVHRRISRLELILSESVRHRRNIVVSIDSSGLKVHNRGEWIRHKHRVRRGWLKIHFAVNARTREIVGLESTKEDVHDNRMFRPILSRILRKSTVKKVLADAAYDDHRNFNLLDRLKITPAIKAKFNSLGHKWHPKWDRRHRVRRKYVSFMLKSFKDWRRRMGYKKRWISEVVFSSFKANFGEYFASRKMVNIKKEILRKAYVHNLLMNHMQRC
jgi:hypothetical protein